LEYLECEKKRILVANRGEIAIRILKAIRELGHSAVAIYSEADKFSPHLTFADEAYFIGESEASKSYLNIDRIIDVAKQNKIDAIHPGYGFLAENTKFADAVKSSNMVWIGPEPKSMYDVGDKIRAREVAKSTGVPIIPGVTLDNNIDPVDAAKRLGFPILIKASAGGGGKGMRIVRNERELLDNINIARKEAESSFADPTIYFEKLLEEPHHIEIQVLADKFGNAYYFPERECSVQRRYQKIVEESPSTTIDRMQAKAMGEAALKVIKKIAYDSAGTVEFMVDKNKNFYFLEVNTRIQVEHPVTEEITGIDLVANQIEVAFGKSLSFNQDSLNIPKGHAIEARVYAEDPVNNFIPSTGKIDYYEIPYGAGIRLDDGACKGFVIPIHYDPIISKVIARGRDRKQSLYRLYYALSNYRILPLKTTIPFIMNIIKHPEFIKGNYDTNFINKNYEKLFDENEEYIPLAIACYYYLSSQGISNDYSLTGGETLKECWENLTNFRG